jgi:hypothetical protein
LINFFILFFCCLNNKLILYLLSNEVGNENGPEQMLERSDFSLSSCPSLSLPLCRHSSPSPRCFAAAATSTGRRVATSSCHCLATAIAKATRRHDAASLLPLSVLLPRSVSLSHLVSSRRYLNVLLHVVLCEFNEPRSQSFGVSAKICSRCVSILILSLIFKHCPNIKNSLAGGASVIGNCAAQVNLWE